MVLGFENFKFLNYNNVGGVGWGGWGQGEIIYSSLWVLNKQLLAVVCWEVFIQDGEYMAKFIWVNSQVKYLFF